MPLAAGSKLGHYEIAELIGKGGMGEVYRARDSKLNRFVALKVLPGALANNPERMARFQREAQLLAQLNHPNIAAIYGLEDSGSHWAIVMELVEGDTLKGPLAVPEVLRLAKQIADAVEYAHDKTVIHRDLKPANIKVTPEGQVKVLDFGLAKALDDAGSSHVEGNPMDSMSPTLTMGGTAAGVILGTAAYMAPEQAKGKRADRKADIWSFGVVLYEMLTGKRVFAGETMAETLASVMKEPLNFDDLPKETPSALRKLVTRCLDRDLKRRTQSMGEVRIALEDILSGAATEEVKIVTQPTPAKTPWLPWAAAAAFAIAGAFGTWAPWRTAAPAPLQRFEIAPPEKTTVANALLLSPDGRHLAWAGNGEGGNKIWVRSLDTLEARAVAPWSGTPSPFWSPDNRFIVFQQDGKLKKVDIGGGPPVPLSDAPQAFGGGAWSVEGVIVFGDRGGPLKQVSSAGGVPVPLTKLDAKREETSHTFPSFLPDNKHFVYFTRSNKPEFTGIAIGEVGVAPEKQAGKFLLATGASAVYSPSPDPREATKGLGFLLFLRESTLMAQPFDAAALQLKGEPVPIAEQVATSPNGFGRFTVSANGALAYATGGTFQDSSQLTWFDRTGKNLGTIGEPGRYISVRISPDGTRVAADKRGARGGTDLWLIDAAPGGRSEAFTFQEGIESTPQWSPDGTQIAYIAEAFTKLFRKPTNLTGREKEASKLPGTSALMDWSRDGKTILYNKFDTGVDILSLNVADGKTTPFVSSAANELTGRFSPDGRWVAFHADATGTSQVYIRPFPANEAGGQQMVSLTGGAFPLWRRDGKELYFWSTGTGVLKVMAVEVIPGPSLRFGPLKELFPRPRNPGAPSPAYIWDVTPDGSRFLFNVAGADPGGVVQAPLTLVLNWTSGLK